MIKQLLIDIRDCVNVKYVECSGERVSEERVSEERRGVGASSVLSMAR